MNVPGNCPGEHFPETLAHGTANNRTGWVRLPPLPGSSADEQESNTLLALLRKKPSVLPPQVRSLALRQ